MDTVNFQCGHCNKLMAVTSNLIGRQVRCPHCQGVVVAPSPGPAAAPPPPAPFPETIFQTRAPSDQDSIFAPPEDHDDDLFGTTPPQPEMPPEPIWQTPPASQPAPMNLELTASPPPPQETVAYQPTAPGPAPMFQNESGSVEVAPPPEPSAAWNAPTLADGADPAAPDEQLPLPQTRVRAPRASNPWLLPLLVVPLVSYAIIVTVLLAYCYMTLEYERSNLKMILPDEGFNQPAQKVSKSGLRRSPVGDLRRKSDGVPLALAALSPSQKTTLGKTIRLGDLEVTPLRADVRKVLITTKGFEVPAPGSDDSVVLFLELKNVSDDTEFAPLDPYFDREYKPNPQNAGLPYTFLAVGDKRFHGGPAIYDDTQHETLAIDGLDESLQEAPGQKLSQRADRVLKPGEKMITFIATNPEHHAGQALKGAGGKGFYRMRLRTGLAHVRDKDVPANMVAGVEISPQ